MSTKYHLIIVGAGPSGMMAAIRAAQNNQPVLLLEKLPKIATKLKATGGGRCNLTNTLEQDAFITRFGREGRFISKALQALDQVKLRHFFHHLGVQTHAPDGFHIFPVGHNSSSIIQALQSKMQSLNITIQCNQRATKLLLNKQHTAVMGVQTAETTFYANHVIIATGGMGYPQLGTEGDGYTLASTVGHTIKGPYPAMMPLTTKERWGANCRADTLPNVTMRIAIKKYRKLQATGDLIFTKTGIRGPVVLDFSREITPLLLHLKEVPIELNLTQGMNEEEIRQYLKTQQQKLHHPTTLTLLKTLLPISVAKELCALTHADPNKGFSKLSGKIRDQLIRYLAWTPLTVIGHDGFKMAMVTRGGIKLKEVNPNTLESKKINGLYFCGEVLDLDGPCGGYNLQWAFSSGYLAGTSISSSSKEAD